MSLTVTVFVPEGIVMAADSRLTLNFDVPLPQGATQKYSIPSSDSTRKLFLASNGIGISTWGVISSAKTPVAPLVEEFLAMEWGTIQKSPDDVAAELLRYIRDAFGKLQTHFHVAGYSGRDKRVIWVDVANNKVVPNDTSNPNVVWGGELEPLTRLFNDVGTVDATGKLRAVLTSFGIAWQHFTLQDAVDFAVFAIRATSESMRFQMRPQTVGGPIDALVIQPGAARWLRLKELRVVDVEKVTVNVPVDHG